jgi:hypothetical protein
VAGDLEAFATGRFREAGVEGEKLDAAAALLEGDQGGGELEGSGGGQRMRFQKNHFAMVHEAQASTELVLDFGYLGLFPLDNLAL